MHPPEVDRLTHALHAFPAEPQAVLARRYQAEMEAIRAAVRRPPTARMMIGFE